MPRLLIDGTDKTKLDDYIPVLAVAKNTANTDETGKQKEIWKSYKKPSEQKYNRKLLKLNVLAHQFAETETVIPDLHKSIEAQSIDTDCRQAAASA